MTWIVLLVMLAFGGAVTLSSLDFMLRVFYLTVPEMAVGCVIWMIWGKEKGYDKRWTSNRT